MEMSAQVLWVSANSKLPYPFCLADVLIVGLKRIICIDIHDNFYSFETCLNHILGTLCNIIY